MNRFRAILALAAAAAVAGCNSSSALPRPVMPASPIQHIVILMQENRSFDNIFAGFPNANTTLEGKCEPAPWCKTGTVKLHSVPLRVGSLGFGKDIDHSHHGFEIECDANASGVCQNDGFDKIHFGEAGGARAAKLFPYAYVDRSETKPYWDFAQQYALADEMLFTDTAASFIAHQMILSGTVRFNATESLTDQPDTNIWGCDAPPGTQTPLLKSDGVEIYPPHKGLPFPCFTQYGTIADLLDPAKVSWTYYVAPMFGTQADFSGAVWNGFDAIKAIRYGADWKTHISRPATNVFKDLKDGNLAGVSWVIPLLADSDHPASGCNHGPHWVTQVVDAVGKSKYWNSTAIIVLWDDWGGWYDNVPPTQINYTSLGFRVPMIVISPYALPSSISHTQYDFGSILKFIEQNFGLGSLHTTDEPATSMADMFDLTQKPLPFKDEPIPHIKSCGAPVDNEAIIEHDGGVPE